MQLVASPTADPGIASLIPARSHSFREFDHEMILYGHSPSADSRRVGVICKQNYVVNRLVKLAQREKIRLG